MAAAQWTIVGGADKGGLLVRDGAKLDAVKLEERLATGSIVEEVALEGDRLSYKLLSGSGPQSGWISVSMKGKELAVRSSQGSKASGSTCLGHTLQKEREEMWEVGPDGIELSVRLAMPSDSTDETKVGCCALFVGGMPQEYYGNSRMEDPLPSAIMSKCWEIGLPTVRFNYRGYGNSKGEEIAEDDKATMQGNFEAILGKVLEVFSHKVAIVAFSAGNAAAALPAIANGGLQEKCLAYVNINMGKRSIAITAPDPMKVRKMPAEEFFKLEAPHIAALAPIPHLYVKGDKDWMSPEADFRYWMELQDKKSKPGSVPREFRTFPGKHAFEQGMEDAPAEAIKEFLARILS